MLRRSGIGSHAPFLKSPAFISICIAFLLCLPVFGLGYFWDDYFFLTKTQANAFAYLIPSPEATFFRPIPQGIYFLLLLGLGPSGAMIGHLLNFVLLATSIALLISLTAKLAGPRAGLLSGVTFAGASCIPSLVAWISCAQDLFAIAFLLTAFHLRRSRRVVGTLVAFAFALLSKETSIVAIPILILWDRLFARERVHERSFAISIGAVSLGWSLLHPGIRSLVSAGFKAGSTGYVGLEQPDRWPLYAVRYVLTLLNLPITGNTTLSLGMGISGVLAVILILFAVGSWSGQGAKPGATTGSSSRARTAALLMTVLPLIPPVIMVRPWAAYFAGIAVIGLSILTGLLLARSKPLVAALFLASYTAVGVLSRGDAVTGELVWTEKTFVEASKAIGHIKVNFSSLRPSLPSSSRILLSVAGTGTRGTYQTLIDGQALRIWYDDPTLITSLPESQRDPGMPVLLFRITASEDVVEIDPTTSHFQSSGGRVDKEEIARPLRSYARGAAASGSTDQAVRILETMSQFDAAHLQSYDLRLASMALRASNRSDEAERERLKAPSLERHEALDMVGKLLAEPTGRVELDTLAFWAFGVSPSDPEALRYIIGQYQIGGYWKPAEALARRLVGIVPGDSLGSAVLRGSRSLNSGNH